MELKKDAAAIRSFHVRKGHKAVFRRATVVNVKEAGARNTRDSKCSIRCFQKNSLSGHLYKTGANVSLGHPLKKNKLALLSIGAIIGIVNGLFGGGGGMVCVPALIYLISMPTKKAHATAIAIILPLCIVSAIMYLCFFDIQLDVTGFAGIGVIAGGIIGALILKKIPNKVIQIMFSLVMVAAGVKLII